MKINRLCKRFAAVLLSLSMIATPVYSSGLSMTSFAAAESKTESNADITVVDNAKELDTVFKDAANGNSNQDGTQEDSQQGSRQSDLNGGASAAGASDGSSQTSTADTQTTSGSADAGSSSAAGSAVTGDNASADSASTGSGSTDASGNAGTDETNTAGGNASSSGTPEGGATGTTAGDSTTAAAGADNSGSSDNSHGTQADSNTQTSSDTQNGGTGSTDGTANSNGAVNGISSNITETFNSNTAINNAGLEQLEEKKFENNADAIELADEDMPAEPEDLIAEYMAAQDESASINLAANDSSNSNAAEAEPDIQVSYRSVYYKDSFTIKYKTVSNKQKTFKFTSAMNPEIDVLYVPYGNDTYFGFKVLSIAVTVKDKNGDELTFYADDIVDGSFYVTMDMQLSNGDRLKDLIYSATPNAENQNWKSYTDATLTSGKYSIKVKKPYGAYLAAKDAGTKEKTGKALIIAVDNDSSLGHTPVEDAEAVKATLTRTHQFKESDIELMIIPSGTSDNYKQEVWDWIDKTAAASGNELTLIAYSGHGGFHNDGTSELSIGGSNTISGTELKSHVSKLHGKVVMLFDSCYSGGMIMPTQELGAGLDELGDATGELGLDDTSEYSEEDYEAYLNELYEQAQDNADAALDSFISEFNKAKGSSTKSSTVNEDDSESEINVASDSSDSVSKAGGSSSTTTGSSSTGSTSKASSSGLKYYIFAAASAYETGLQNDNLGGQITDLFGYALGYSRKDSAYNIYAADINADHKVTGKELAEYIKSNSVVSKPSVYYPTSSASEALFSYDAASGLSGILSVTSVDSKNLVMDATTGEVKVNVKVTNNSKASVTFDAGAILATNTYELCPGAIDPSSYAASDRAQIFYKAGVNKKTIAAGKVDEVFTLTFTDTTKKYFSAGRRFIIKIWGTGAADSESFALTDFYTGKAATAAAADQTALKIKEPAQVWSASSSNIVSSIVPINVVFDTEPTTKSGYAALTLTAKAYDLGETDGRKESYSKEPQIRGYGVDKYGNIVLDDVKVAEGSLKSIDIYKDIRPTYVRDDMYDLDGNGSNYNYAWDVSGLTKGHYYALQITCTYDDKKVAKKTTFIKVTDKATADGTTKTIGESFIGMNDYASSFYGLKLGETWKKYGKGATVDKISADMEEYLAYSSYKYNGKTNDIEYTIADDGSIDGNKTGWFELNKDNTLRPMAENEFFNAGHSYVNRIILTIDSGYKAKFAYGCAFTVAGHELYSEGKYKSAVLAGQKKAVLYIKHKNIGVGIAEDKIKVYRAGTKTEIKSTDTIKIGDQIDVQVPTGYKVTASEKWDCLKKVDTKDTDYTRYEVVQSEGDSNEIKIVMYKAFNAADKDDCCATVFYTHAISGSSQQISSITAPNKTFYEYTGKTSKLDLTGAKVDYYALNSKKEYELKTVDLSTFIKNNKAKLCYKSGDKYYEWKDNSLKDFGLYTIYLSYNGEYTQAFDVEVGYSQGKKFSINGNLTYNKNGSVSYVKKDDLKNVVLGLYLDSDVKSNCQGTINVSQYIKMKYSNVNASGYDYLYYTEGAKVKFVVPYPQGIKYSKFLVANVEDENKNVPVTLEVKQDGIWVTAYRSGDFTINIDTGGKGGPDDPDSDGNRARNSSGRTANGGSGSGTNSKVYGTWQTDTLKVGAAGASGVINVNGTYVVPSTGVIEPDGSSSAASAIGTETVTLYRFTMNNGEYATGWKQISYKNEYKWFFFGNDGYMRVGWAHDNNNWYYLHSDGTMATGWIQNKDAWYYLGTDGKMTTGWQQIGGKWYYLDTDGHMLTGQQVIGGKSYSFRQDGSWIEA